MPAKRSTGRSFGPKRVACESIRFVPGNQFEVVTLSIDPRETPQLAANKKLVFDMWRAIIQGAHTELAPQYFTPDYIQHNPNVATGRDAMVAYLKATRPVKPIAPTITFPLVTIMAEGDKVLVASVSYSPDPEHPGQKYAGTHFDLFRIEHGKIAEHWDSVAKDKAALHFDPNTMSKP